MHNVGMLSALFPNVPIISTVQYIVALTATEKTRNIISNSLGMVDPVSQTERTYFTLLEDANIQVMIKIKAFLLPYIAKLKDLLMSSSFGQQAAMMHR